MTNSTKHSALIFLFSAVLIILLLAGALPRMELQAGIPLPRYDNLGETISSEEEKLEVSIKVSTFIKTVISLLIIMMLINLVSKGLKNWHWNKIAPVVLRMSLLALLITALFFALANVRVTMSPAEFEVLPTELDPVGPPLEPVPHSLIWLVWVLLGLGTILLVSVLLWWRNAPKIAKDPLVLEAEQAVQSILAGQDLRNVIIRCYRQMSQILQQEQGLTRTDAMTAREFEALLATRGVPDMPVHQLTRLFETARYGAYPAGPDEEQQAIACLNAIIQFSRSKEASPQP